MEAAVDYPGMGFTKIRQEGITLNKEQFKADAANVDKQMTGAAAAFGAPKWVLYVVGVLALVGIVTLISRL